MSQTFDLFPLRFHCQARTNIRLDANFLRGQFGKSLMKIDPEAYHRLFQPRSTTGPSGLRNAPRPFVFRVGAKDLAAHEDFDLGFHLFEVREPPFDLLERVFGEFAELKAVEGALLRLPVQCPRNGVTRIRVRFITPTQLKGGDSPEFGLLFSRIRDRVSSLRALYGGGPLEIDFKEMGARASKIVISRCEIEQVDAARVSRSTGQRHSLGGFVGVAEYEGELAEFLPYLEIARFTGVGRLTVWGNGEIACEAF